MSRYSKEKKKEHLAIVKRILVRKPDATLMQIMDIFKKNNQKICINYANKLANNIQHERAVRYGHYTRSIVMANYEDFIKELEPLLRNISENSKDEKARVMAIRQLVDNKRAILNALMDLGLLDRVLGKVEVYDVAEIAKLVKNANEQRNNRQINSE